MTASERLRLKGQRFVREARNTACPIARKQLLRSAALTLRQGREARAAEYGVTVGRGNVSLAGYRDWIRQS